MMQSLIQYRVEKKVANCVDSHMYLKKRKEEVFMAEEKAIQP